MEIQNNSYVSVDDIGGLRGATSEGLLCHSDAFIHGSKLNNTAWYFPNGSKVWHYSQFITHYGSVPSTSFEINTGYGLLRLFTRGSPSEVGLFKCTITNANNVVERLYVTIGEFIVIIVHIIVLPN